MYSTHPAGRTNCCAACSMIEQALECHVGHPFDAILFSAHHDSDDVLNVSEGLLGEPRWSAEHGIRVPRTGRVLAQVLQPLLCRCRQLHIVDAHFMPSGGTKRRWLNPVEEISRVLHGNKNLATFELHTLDKPRGSWELEVFKKNCIAHLPNVVRARSRFTARLWAERDGGIELHQRLIVTDIYRWRRNRSGDRRG